VSVKFFEATKCENGVINVEVSTYDKCESPWFYHRQEEKRQSNLSWLILLDLLLFLLAFLVILII
jgi:hypothetical protein